MKIIKEKKALVIDKNDLIYDLVVHCWTVKHKYYKLSDSTTDEIEFNDFIADKIFGSLMRALIKKCNNEKEHTHHLRIIIAQLLLFKIEDKLDINNEKDMTDFNTMQSNISGKITLTVPKDFEFTVLPNYENDRIKELLKDYIIHDLIRIKNSKIIENSPGKGSKLDKATKNLSRKGSMLRNKGSKILSSVAETAREHSPFRRQRSDSTVNAESPPAPSRLQISAPITHSDKPDSDRENAEASESETTSLDESGLLLPPSASNTKNPSYGSISSGISPPSSAPSAPSAAFFPPSIPPSKARAKPAADYSASTQGDNNLPAVKLSFLVYFSRETGKIVITCPDISHAKKLHARFGSSISTIMYDNVRISPEDWAKNKERFNSNLPKEFQECAQFIEKTYCTVTNKPYKPPAEILLPTRGTSLNNEQDAQSEEDEAKRRFCCC